MDERPILQSPRPPARRRGPRAGLQPGCWPSMPRLRKLACFVTCASAAGVSGTFVSMGRLTRNRARRQRKRPDGKADPKVSPTAAMSEAGHHARANRWDDAAAGGQGHGATRRQREEVIAVHLAACRNGKRHVRRPRQSQRWQTDELGRTLSEIGAGGGRALRLGRRPQPPFTGEGPGVDQADRKGTPVMPPVDGDRRGEWNNATAPAPPGARRAGKFAIARRLPALTSPACPRRLLSLR